MDDVVFNSVVRHEMRSKRKLLKQRLRDWGFVDKNDSEYRHPTKAGTYLAKLFGFEEYQSFMQATQDNHAYWSEKLDRLSSAHGYALLKMLEARKSENDSGNKHTDGC